VQNRSEVLRVILAVAIDTPLRRLFDYRAPDGSAEAQPGQRIWVPFGRRRVVGVVVERRAQSDVPENKLRTALGLVENEPTLDAGLLDLLRWSADYYRHPLGEVISTALPVALRAGIPLAQKVFAWRLTDLGCQEANAKLSSRATALRAIVERLSREPLDDMAVIESGLSREGLKKLEERGYVERFVPDQPATPASVRESGPALNEAQQEAVSKIQASLGSFATWLLHGVTGSGKTEVYLHAIATCLARGRQALVLVPEIALTPQLLTRFRARFDARIAVLHSALNDTERLNAWRDARSGAARIVIGTRSAVFAPLPEPGIIVIDEEHDASFKQQDGFRYSARDLAIVRAQRCGIPIVLGSATPSLESLARAHKQAGSLLSLPNRAADAKPPKMALVDLRKNPQEQGIATPVLSSMQQHLAAGRQVMLFLNRRGYAPVLFCPNCGWAAHCRRCDAHLTVHRNSSELLCHHCGSQETAPATCPSCSRDVKPVGQGTERIEETIERLFPGMPLARIDRDSMRRKGELEATLAQVDRNEIRILVGTQMLTKGHHFPNVTLVVVLNADQGLFSTDFRASERLAQTIVQVAGRAGRAEAVGEVLIQTEYPLHPLLTLLLKGGYDAFATGALAEREQAGWPPFARLALLRAEATRAHEAMTFLRAAASLASAQLARGVEVLGPAPAPMERRAGRHRAQLLLRADSHVPLQRLLSTWVPELESLQEARKVRWSIDVDPAELF
jgi:primosomal protein N' (replication factor Y) (superfamily II helicase)